MAFDGSRDYDGSGKLDKEHVMRSKLAMEMMPWQMARLNPRQWQERKHIDNTSVQASVAEMSVEQRQALVDGMLARMQLIARPAIEEERRLEEPRAKKSRIIDVTLPEPAPVPVPKTGATGR